MTYEEACAFALTLDGAEAASHYGQPAVKARGRAILSPGHEEGSFCLHVDRDTVEMLKETDPATFWQTAHYEGWPAVLVRCGSRDRERICAMIERARDQALARRLRRPR